MQTLPGKRAARRLTIRLAPRLAAVLAFMAVLAAPQALRAQRRVTIALDSARFDTLVQIVEHQAAVHFFYDTTQTDSLKITLHVTDELLEKALTLALDRTGLFFAVDANGNIFISKGYALELGTPAFQPDTGAIAKTEQHVNRRPVQDAARETPSTEEQDATLREAVIQAKLFIVGEKSDKPGNVTLAGYVRDAKSEEPIIGASIVVDNSHNGVATDQYGYYSLSLPRGRHVLYIQSIGMRDTRRQVQVNGEGRFNIEMQGQVLALRNVVISSEKASNIRSLTMGMQRLDIKAIKQVPVVFGEADVLRVVLTLPGVKSVGESSTGMNVRGGAADQNLILLNDATIYNPSHFFGLFSAFSPEIVKDVELYKSSIPAQYGGRLSSVLDVSTREGNKKQYEGSAGVGLLTSRLNLEGPIVKDKSSFIIGARTTYANWLLNLLPDQYKNSRASFYDINLGITQEINKRNTLFITGYLSQDRFNLNSDTTYSYGNRNASLKWKHIFNNKLNMEAVTGYDRYQYRIDAINNPVTASRLGFDINQFYLKDHFKYYLNSKHTLEFGFQSIHYKLHPGTYTPVGDKSLTIPDTLQTERALESALFLSDEYKVTGDLSIEAGIRYSMFNFLGPSNVNDYAPGEPLTAGNLTGTTPYPGGKFIKTYSGPEYRLSTRYSLGENTSLKASFNTGRQYIHMLSNTTAMAPTDIWKLSDTHILPTTGAQYSLGLYRNFASNTIETSVEVYYRNMDNYLDYKDGAVLVMNHHIETDVMSTHGRAYGVELLVRKQTGKLNGWFSYTYSRTQLQMNDPLAGEIVNGGNWYPASYDEPHDVNLVGNYKVNHRFSVSLNTVYNTGRPITLPIGVFYYAGSERALYSDRNAYRIPDYFRMDLAMNIEGNHKIHQKTHNSWTIGVYNLTGRQNPYSVYFVSQNGVVNGYKLSIFGSAIPYINFNIRF